MQGRRPVASLMFCLVAADRRGALRVIGAAGRDGILVRSGPGRSFYLAGQWHGPLGTRHAGLPGHFPGTPDPVP
jgi:hypothetical protein